MRKIKPSSAFRKDLKLIKKQGKKFDLIKHVINQLALGKELHARYKDHPLKGDLKGARECHIKDDWIMIYEMTPHTLHLIRTGSHADLYKC